MATAFFGEGGKYVTKSKYINKTVTKQNKTPETYHAA